MTIMYSSSRPRNDAARNLAREGLSLGQRRARRRLGPISREGADADVLLAQAGNHRRAGGDCLIIIDYAPERKPVSKRHLRVTLPIRPVGRRPQQVLPATR